SLYASRAHRDRHSFPTRRSSDLAVQLAHEHAGHLGVVGPRPRTRRCRGVVKMLHGGARNEELRPERVTHAQPFETVVADGEIGRSEEHTSELQSQSNLVCRLLLE